METGKQGIIIIKGRLTIATKNINMLSIKENILSIHFKYPIVEPGLAPVHHFALTFKSEAELIEWHSAIANAIHNNVALILNP